MNATKNHVYVIGTAMEMISRIISNYSEYIIGLFYIKILFLQWKNTVLKTNLVSNWNMTTQDNMGPQMGPQIGH